MVDEKNNEEHHDDFEHEFDFENESEDILAPEEPARESTATPAAKPGMSDTQRKTMLPALIGVIVIAFLGWKAFSWLHHKKPVEQPKIVKQETAPAKIAPPPQTEMGQQIAPPPSAPVESPLEESVNKIQKKIDEQNAATQQQIKNLEKDLASAAQSSINSTKSIAALQQEMAALNNVVQNLSYELKSMKEELAKKPAPAPAPKEHHHKPKPKLSEENFANPNLTVYAIIPGRAWLRTPNGKTVTVTEGDSIGEYGKVLKIDAGNGVVITSTGVTLR